VVNSVPDDTQLGQLLTQLLRAVSPVPSAERLQKAAQPEAYAVAAAGSATGAGAPAEAGQATEGPAPGGPEPPSVTSSEARALIELMSARGIAQGELAALLGLDKSTVSRLAAGLERKGWIRRGRDEDNQRYVRLYLTVQGAEVAERVWQAWQSRQARIIAALSSDECAGLSAGLRGLVRGLAAEGLLSDVRGGAGES
jgi:DNA-binding MarR family transcriptional regulator